MPRQRPRAWCRWTLLKKYVSESNSWINFPASGETLYFPADTETIRFEALWEGIDNDGEILAFQYVLDPTVNAYRVCQVTEEQMCTSIEYELRAGYGWVDTVDFADARLDSGRHEFRVRCQDASGCWETSWNRHYFYVYPEER